MRRGRDRGNSLPSSLLTAPHITPFYNINIIRGGSVMADGHHSDTLTPMHTVD